MEGAIVARRMDTSVLRSRLDCLEIGRGVPSGMSLVRSFRLEILTDCKTAISQEYGQWASVKIGFRKSQTRGLGFRKGQ